MSKNFHLFRKSLKSGKKVQRRWYYYFYDDEGNRVQRVCKGCRTREEAMLFVSELEREKVRPLSVKDVASSMFVRGSDHIERLEALGKTVSEKTLKCYRTYIDLIIEKFGNVPIEKVSIKDVTNYLMAIDKSGSWKNSYCEVFSKIFDEANWLLDGHLAKPTFPRFARNSKKADILTSEELARLFDSSLWQDKMFYLLFLCTATCGLRLGEARALRAGQFLFDQNALVIDGFCKQNGERTNYNKKGSNEDSKMRVVVLPDLTKRLVKTYIEKNNIDSNDFVFSKDCKPLRQEYCESVFSRQLVKSNIEKNGRKITPHSLRFTYVTLMRRNLDGETVQKLVGHSSIEMTDYYTRISIPELAKSLQVAKSAADNILIETI